MAFLSCLSFLCFLNNCVEFKIQFSAVNLGIILHTTLIYAGFVLSAYIIDLFGFRFFWDTLYIEKIIRPYDVTLIYAAYAK